MTHLDDAISWLELFDTEGTIPRALHDVLEEWREDNAYYSAGAFDALLRAAMEKEDTEEDTDLIERGNGNLSRNSQNLETRPFRVTLSATVFFFVDVQARNANEAKEVALQTEVGAMVPVRQPTNWRVIEVEEAVLA